MPHAFPPKNDKIQIVSENKYRIQCSEDGREVIEVKAGLTRKIPPL